MECLGNGAVLTLLRAFIFLIARWIVKYERDNRDGIRKALILVVLFIILISFPYTFIKYFE